MATFHENQLAFISFVPAHFGFLGEGNATTDIGGAASVKYIRNDLIVSIDLEIASSGILVALYRDYNLLETYMILEEVADAIGLEYENVQSSYPLPLPEHSFHPILEQKANLIKQVLPVVAENFESILRQVKEQRKAHQSSGCSLFILSLLLDSRVIGK